MTEILTNIEMVLALVIFPTIAGFLTYHVIKANTVAHRNRTYAEVMRELEMQAEVREANQPWWAAR